VEGADRRSIESDETPTLEHPIEDGLRQVLVVQHSAQAPLGALDEVAALHCAPALRAPSAAWNRPPRGSHVALIVGGRSGSSNGKDGIGVPR
jgi:hypothetical protein